METKTEGSSMALVPVDLVGQALAVKSLVTQANMIVEAMRALMKEHVHFGKIPGCPKPSLWQPGADLLNLMFRLRPEFSIISSARQDGLIAYAVQCNLVHVPSGQLVAVGIGSCNTREDKYHKTIQRRGCSPWDLDNTILKMAVKRAKIAATLNGTGAAEVFSQDVVDEEEPTAPAPGAAGPVPEPRRRGRPRGPSVVTAATETAPRPAPEPEIVPQEEAQSPGEATAAELWDELRELQGRIADPNGLRRIHQAAGGYVTQESPREILLKAISEAQQILGM